jgi:hypothetical protein
MTRENRTRFATDSRIGRGKKQCQTSIGKVARAPDALPQPNATVVVARVRLQVGATGGTSTPGVGSSPD